MGQSVLETQETTCKGDGAEQLGIWRTRKGLVELGHKAGLEDCGGQGSRGEQHLAFTAPSLLNLAQDWLQN